MTSKEKKRLFKLVGWLAALYIFGGVVLFLIQDLLLFHPIALTADYRYNIQQPFVEHNLVQKDGSNLAMVQFKTSKIRKGVVLYFHGNMRNVERYAPYSTLFTENGYDVWMPDYRGFGKSTGKRTEEGFYGDALIVYQKAVESTSADQIIIYGKSLGTGIATQLAATHPCKKLILETPYYSLPHIAKDKFPLYPVNWLIKYQIPTYQFLPRVKTHTTLFHGTADEVIAYSHARKLKEDNKQVELITITGGNHNDLLSYKQVSDHLKSLLSL